MSRFRWAVAVILALVAIAGAVGRATRTPDASAAQTLYTCAMHPQIIRKRRLPHLRHGPGAEGRSPARAAQRVR